MFCCRLDAVAYIELRKCRVLMQNQCKLHLNGKAMRIKSNVWEINKTVQQYYYKVELLALWETKKKYNRNKNFCLRQPHAADVNNRQKSEQQTDKNNKSSDLLTPHRFFRNGEDVAAYVHRRPCCIHNKWTGRRCFRCCGRTVQISKAMFARWLTRFVLKSAPSASLCGWDDLAPGLPMGDETIRVYTHIFFD